MNFGIIEGLVVLVFFISFYGLITSRSVLKSIVSIGIMETSVIMFFLSLGYVDGMTPPIGLNLENVADPLPQALMLTAIIIGVAVTAINLTMSISLCRKFKTTDWDIVRKRNME